MTRAEYAEHYTRMGFALVPIPYGSKAPKGSAWQDNTTTDPDEARRRWNRCRNMGLEHGRSGTGTLDIDNPKAAAIAFEYVGLDLEKLLQYPTVHIIGKNGRKPLYDMRGLNLAHNQLRWPHPSEKLASGSPKYEVVFELRTGAGKQDVLPPSLHPDGMLYGWDREPLRRSDLLPPPPDLLELWRDPRRLSLMRRACPWREVAEVPERPRRPQKPLEEKERVIDAYNERVSPHELLERYGYTRSGAHRYLPPESKTKTAGAYLYRGHDGLERVVVYNASSPLSYVDGEGRNRGATAFGIFCEYEHRGDVHAAVKAAAAELGMTYSGPDWLERVSVFGAPSPWGRSSGWSKASSPWGRVSSPWGKKCR